MVDDVYDDTNNGMIENRTQDHRYADQSTPSYASEIFKMIPNLATFHWRKTRPWHNIYLLYRLSISFIFSSFIMYKYTVRN